MIQRSTKPFHWIGIRKNLKRWADLEDTFVPLSLQALATHAYVIGATGSGKTTLLQHLIAQNILLGHAFIILDLRGDLVSLALELCAGRVDPRKVAIFDFREKERPLGFNPLSGAGEPYFRALAVLDAIATESESWGVQLAETLRFALLLLAESGMPLTVLERLFFEAAFRESLVRKAKDESVKGFWERYGNLSKDRQTNMATPVLNKVSLLLSTPSLKKTLGHPNPFDLGKHLNTHGSVTLISLAVDELHGAGRMMGNLLLASICREIFARVTIPESDRVPIQFFVDEFEHFNAKEFENLLAEGRRFRCSLILAHQTLAQLNTRVRSMIVNNVGVKAVFRIGHENSATMSKDLTGDAKALNLSNLPVGECMLWQRGQDLLRVMVNAPLVKNVGTRTPEAATYIEEIRALVPEFKELQTVDITAEPESSKQRPSSKTSDSLGDWL
jgi:DNA helicase HerA-like ATPase